MASTSPYLPSPTPPTPPAPNILIHFAARSIHSLPFRRCLRVLPLTCAFTFFATLLLVHSTYTTLGLHPPQGIVCQDQASSAWIAPTTCLEQHILNTSTTLRYFNISKLYATCRSQLCDISVYGGWFAGPEHVYFRTGMTVLAVQLLLLLYGRMGLLQYVAPEELRQPCCCAGIVVVRNQETCCSPSRCATLFGPVAVLCILPMAFIPFYVSMFHFLSAVVTFLTLAIAELADAVVQLRILQRRSPGSVCCDLSGVGMLQVVFNFTFAAGGLLCFVLWGVSTYFEWLAASLPFLYFAPFVWQMNWYDTCTTLMEERRRAGLDEEGERNGADVDVDNALTLKTFE